MPARLQSGTVSRRKKRDAAAARQALQAEKKSERDRRRELPKKDLRSYQDDAIEVGKVKNVAIILDTGLGKTLVAARLIDHFLLLEEQQEEGVCVACMLCGLCCLLLRMHLNLL